MKEKQTFSYVKEQMTLALLDLMEENQFNDISITAITKKACVGRASFYRNFATKEDIIQQYLSVLLGNWKQEFESSGETEPTKLFTSLFEHLKRNSRTYLLLHENHLLYFLLDYIKSECGPRPGHTSRIAYQHAFFAYGLYGWIEEWIKRGMKESPENMGKLVEATTYNSNK